jgi:hypothetical protein
MILISIFKSQDRQDANRILMKELHSFGTLKISKLLVKSKSEVRNLRFPKLSLNSQQAVG